MLKGCWLPSADCQQLSFQLLSCNIQIEFQDPALADKLLFLHCSARQAIPVARTLNYRVEGHGPYALFEEGDLAETGATPADVLHLVYERIYLRATEPFTQAGWIGYHGALAEIGGRHFALLGDKGAGKSTLCSNLVAAGFAVQGDEVFLVKGSQAIAQPRRFHLKPGTRKQVPGLDALWEDLPYQLSGSMKVRAMDPGSLGTDWQIAPVELDAIVWITPNHGEDTTLTPLDSFKTLQHLLASARLWQGDRADIVRQATRLAGRGGWELRFGTPAEALSQLAGIGTTHA